MRRFAWAVLVVLLASCAALPALDPPRVSVADIRAVSVEGWELRMLLELRVQNPNRLAIDYDGLDVKLDLQGKTVATGVSAERGSIPAYGESLVALPMRVSLVNLGRQALRMFGNGTPERLHYALEGKLGSPLFGATRFHAEGELALPGE